ncbi:MAG TPA: archaellin/type IV pilin N-terminal domain-containing protein [Nitrososphaerales archaeon]|nr:archaellin/type IV pilin N-terminal domain-containing protein [Nitrososphaerales archaeon]
MNKLKCMKQKKGISPIIATLLLILIAIAAGVIVYEYVINFVGNSTGNNGGGTNTLSIDQFTASSKVTAFPATVYLRNEGPAAESLNNGFYITGSTNLQLAPAISLALASGSITVTNVAFTATGTNALTVTLTCSGTGTATVSGFGTSGTTGACSGTATATLTLASGIIFSSTIASANTAFSGVALSANQVVAGVPLTAGTITVPINTVITLTLAAQGQQVASGAGAGQANQPLSSGQTYTIKVTGTDGSSTVASSKAA